MKTLKRIALVLAVLVGVLVLFVPFISRGFLTKLAARQASQLMETRIELDSASLYILQRGVALRGLRVYHPDRTQEKVVDIKKLFVQIDPISLARGEINRLKLNLEEPKIVYATNRAGDWELSKKFPLLNRGSNEKRVKPFNVEEIVIEDGELEYRDGHVSSPATVTHLNDINVEVHRLSLPTASKPLPTDFEASLKIENDATFKVKGKGDFLSPKISLEADAQLKDLPIKDFAPYYADSIPVRITHGELSMTSPVRCSKDILNAPAHVTLHDLKVEPKNLNILGGVTNSAVDSLKNDQGDIEMDITVSGNIRNPQFHGLSHFTEAFTAKLGKSLSGLDTEKIKEIGDGVKKEVGSGLKKLKGLFK